jgi:hypothetical protein
MIKIYTKSETCFKNELDRQSPIMYSRFAKVFVYRAPWDFFGFWDNEVEQWGDWKEIPAFLTGCQQ